MCMHRMGCVAHVRRIPRPAATGLKLASSGTKQYPSLTCATACLKSWAASGFSPASIPEGPASHTQHAGTSHTP